MKLSAPHILTACALVALACGGMICQRTRKSAYTLTEAPSPVAEMIVAGLGGFRGIVAEVVWFRADRLQDEGRYAELAQLSTWLTFLEPRTPEVWAYAAWNLAYNISVTMPTPSDRWRWVEAGMKLLRDDGLRINPVDSMLHRELAWLFLLKLCGDLDEAAPYYREMWKSKIEECIKSGDWTSLGLDDAHRAAIDAEYGKQEWTDPLATALYHAVRGFACAKSPAQKHDLRQVIYQTLMMESRKDARFAPRALKELRTAYEENPSDLLKQLIINFKARFSLE